MAELTGKDATTEPYFGRSVAISGDGTTAVIGAPGDSSNAGAVWVFTRSGSEWQQPGVKLQGAGAVGAPYLGYSLAVSADGNTVLAGGPFDHESHGAVSAFTRSGATWAQQGQPLTGTGEEGSGYFGWSVALAGDGSTALIGAPNDRNEHQYTGAGAAWVFTRAGTVWSQDGAKLTGRAPNRVCVQRFSGRVSRSLPTARRSRRGTLRRRYQRKL